MDGLVRVNGEATEVSTSPASLQHTPQEIQDITSKQPEKDITPIHTQKDVSPEEKVKNKETTEQPPPPQTEKSAASSGSAISSLIGGRNCIITTTIVTELTQTHVEPLHPDKQSSGQVFPAGCMWDSTLDSICVSCALAHCTHFIFLLTRFKRKQKLLTFRQTLVSVLICAL